MTALPESPITFRFARRDLDIDSGRVDLFWEVAHADGSQIFQERFDFGPAADPARLADDSLRVALSAALDLLHWIAGVSYWKLACRGRVEFLARAPTIVQGEFLEKLYREGLAELAWRNELEWSWWPDFSSDAKDRSHQAGTPKLMNRALVPMGGGKDSLVALERIRKSGVDADTVQVGQAPLIARVADATGLPHRQIGRVLDPQLAVLNRAGAINGHVPITAINSAALAFAALWWDFDRVVFANERSASSPMPLEIAGVAVNHQYAKSWDFESGFDQRVRHDIAANLQVFSMLRCDSELAVCREFAQLNRYHSVFSSCNRNFHLDGPRTRRWCLNCPKCRFVFLGLAPFMSPRALRTIFGADLLDDPAQQSGFAALLELDGPRPFECIGEAAESRSALAALAIRPEWREHAVVKSLYRCLSGLEVAPLDDWLVAQGSHRIPDDLACA